MLVRIRLVRIFIYLFSFLCLYCVDVSFGIPFENGPKISSKNDFQLYKVTLMFSSRNITFKSNHQWKLLDGIPKIIVGETVQLNKYETDRYFLQNFQCKTMLIPRLCKICEHEIVLQECKSKQKQFQVHNSYKTRE
jgi:hypothetical protein